MTKPLEQFVIFDDDCLLCRNLAYFSQRILATELSFVAKSQVPSDFAHLSWEGELMFVDHAEIYSGREAWQQLVDQYTALRQLDWLAAKIGLSGIVARTLHHAGHAARRLCHSCR